MSTINFHILIKEKKEENWHLLAFHCRYFHEICLEMFVEWSFSKHIFYVQMVVMATKRLSLRKKKCIPQKLYGG